MDRMTKHLCVCVCVGVCVCVYVLQVCLCVLWKTACDWTPLKEGCFKMRNRGTPPELNSHTHTHTHTKQREAGGAVVRMSLLSFLPAVGSYRFRK